MHLCSWRSLWLHLCRMRQVHLHAPDDLGVRRLGTATRGCASDSMACPAVMACSTGAITTLHHGHLGWASPTNCRVPMAQQWVLLTLSFSIERAPLRATFARPELARGTTLRAEVAGSIQLALKRVVLAPSHAAAFAAWRPAGSARPCPRYPMIPPPLPAQAATPTPTPCCRT